MDTLTYIKRFEELVSKVKRPGIDKLMGYIRASDFYTAPASGRFHLSVQGGLLLHSLNVYDCLMQMVTEEEIVQGKQMYSFKLLGHELIRVPEETLIISALFHDLCKTSFYVKDYRNKKVYSESGTKQDAGGRFDWIQEECYTIEDQFPYGHGEKSVMLLNLYIYLTFEEKMAIRWHMGAAGLLGVDQQTCWDAAKKYPLVLLLQVADQMASLFVEEEKGNKTDFVY